jgi:hypothetical protein
MTNFQILMSFYQNPVVASRQSAAFFAQDQEVGGALPRRRYAQRGFGSKLKGWS